MLAESQLELLGHQVTMVNDGADAITAVECHRYDVVLMDWHMPEVDGLEATRRIRSAGHTDLPIIAVTASALAEDRSKCLAAGMTDYLTKPVSLAALRKTLEPWAGAAPVATASSKTPAEPDAGEVIDADTIRVLVTDLGADAVHSLAAAFCAELPSWLASAQEGITRSDLSVVRQTAHTLKSTAALLGALPLAELSAEIEHAAGEAPDDSTDAVDTRLTHVATLVDRLVGEAQAAAAAITPLIDDLEAAAPDTQPMN